MTQLALLPSPSFQPYYIAYARARGMTPEAIRDRDRRIWPGLPGVGFAFWIQRRWREWDAETQRRGGEFHTPAEREAFETWLQKWANNKSARGAME